MGLECASEYERELKIREIKENIDNEELFDGNPE
jgi:hypothetical protein